MKSKTFIILLAICGVLAVASYLVLNPGGSSTTEQGKTDGKVLADLPVNDIAAIDLKSPKGEVRLEKGEKVWEVKSRFGYPANFSKVAEFARKLRDMKVGRSFDASDETRSRLALRKPDLADASEESRGTRITLKDKEQKVLADLLVGKAREASGGNGGHYVMKTGEKVIYLVDKDFRYIDMEPEEWLEKDFLDVQSADVKEVVCTDPKTGKMVYTIRRPEKDKLPEFVDLPEGKKAITSKMTNLMGALAGLNIEDVAKTDISSQKTALNTALCFEFHLFNGTVYKVCPGSALSGKPNYHYFKATVAYAEPEKPAEKSDEAVKPDEAKTEKSDEAVKPDEAKAEKPDEVKEAEEKKAEDEKAEKTPVQLRADAEKLNQKLTSWVFIVPKWKVGHLIENPEDFFEKPKAEEKNQPSS